MHPAEPKNAAFGHNDRLESSAAVIEARMSGQMSATPFIVGEPLTQTQADTIALRLEVATYIAQMSIELSGMARSSDLSLLSYFLDMAAAEARESAGRLDPPVIDASSQPPCRQPDHTLT